MVKKHQITIITMMAILTVVVIGICIYLFETSERVGQIQVVEKNGVYDLSNISDVTSNVIILEPDEQYYPNMLLTPDEIEKAIPVNTDQFQELQAEYLTQHFHIILPDTANEYAMHFSLSGRHAMRVYVNGSLVAETGKVAETKDGTEVWENNIDFYASAIDGEMDIVLNSAQFYHAKRGASLASLSITDEKYGVSTTILSQIRGMVIVGAFLCAGVLLIGIFMLSRTTVTLFFAIACVVMAIRETLQCQAWVYFHISGNVAFMLEYLSVVFLTIFLSLYLGQYVVNKVMRGIQVAAIAVSCIYGVLILFTDSIFYTSVLVYYQIGIVVCIVPGIILLFWNMRTPEKEQRTALYGIAVFFMAAVSDIVMYSEWFGNFYNVPAISEIAMLVFAIAQTVSLFQMNNRILGESKAAEHKLILDKEALESLNRLKTEFLGNVSHEFKTPLTVMSGYAQTTRQMAEEGVELERKEVSRRMVLISSEAERLSLLVTQILDVTRMEEGHMIFEPKKCYLDEIIHRTVETYYPILNKNGNRLNIQIEAPLPEIYADPARISQVIVNLITNAVHFTTDGIITIKAKHIQEGILTSISDTGNGIAKELLPHLFERYYNTSTMKGKDTGTGLGLYICKYIVEQSGGSIWAESLQEKGTTFFFLLPLQDDQ